MKLQELEPLPNILSFPLSNIVTMWHSFQRLFQYWSVLWVGYRRKTRLFFSYVSVRKERLFLLNILISSNLKKSAPACGHSQKWNLKELKCLVQTWPDYFTVTLSKSCYTNTSNQSKYRSKAQISFHLLEDIVTNFIVKWNKRKITAANFSQYTCQHIIRNSQQIRTLNWICRYFMMHVFIVSVVRGLRKTLIVYRIFPGFFLFLLV